MCVSDQASFTSYRQWTAVGALAWLCFMGEAQAASIFRCIDTRGHIEFRQTACAAGGGQRLRVRVPKIGWLKPKPPTVITNEQRGVSEEPTQTRGAAATPSDRRRCWQAEQRLQRIQRQLRKGYKSAQGERLRQQRREQEDFRRRFCR